MLKLEEASDSVEYRDAAIGVTEDQTMLFVVHIYREGAFVRIISARLSPRTKGNLMKTLTDRLKIRIAKNRPMTTISIRLPEDVIDDLKEIAPALGFSGYQPLIRAYIGQGLRKHLAELSNSPMQAVADSLRKQGIPDQVIADAIADASHTVMGNLLPNVR